MVAGSVRAAALLALASGGCAPKVRVTVLDYPEITVPPELRTVAVVDRTGAPEGRSAVAGFTRWLGDTQRFVVVVGSDADLVVTVEDLDLSSSLAVEEALAIRSSRVALTWRLADRSGETLDALVGVETADRWTAPRDDDGGRVLPGEAETTAALAESSGVAYARRLSARNQELVRDTFVRGDRRLRYAQAAVRTGNWDRAMNLWSEVTQVADPTLAARAHYDLAVGYEVEGEVRRALDHADRAAALDDGERFARYREALVRANGDQRPFRPTTRED